MWGGETYNRYIDNKIIMILYIDDTFLNKHYMQCNALKMNAPYSVPALKHKGLISVRYLYAAGHQPALHSSLLIVPL